VSRQLRQLNADTGQSAPVQLSANAWRIAVPALSFLAGLAYAFVVIGPRVLNPFNLSWMEGDPEAAYLGWAFFRQETHLTFPLGWSQAIGYPFGQSVAYFGSIPLIATVGWLSRNVIPENIQYFGIYFALCSALQFYFGYRISRRVCGDDAVAGILGGALFLIAPAFTWRASVHFSSTSQWIILAALDQWLRATGRPSAAQIASTAAICLIAASIDGYITLMVLLVSCATYVGPLLGQSRCLGRSCLGLGVALCSTLLGLWLFGFIRTADMSKYIGSGYEDYSMNLLAPIDPQFYGALLLKEHRSIGWGQRMEGYNYLGLGILLIGLVSIARRPSSLRYLFAGRTAPALVVFVVLLVLALSTKATFGPYVLYHVTLPHRIMDVLKSFRASGRLFWPGYYLIFTGVIAAAFRAFRGWWLHGALTVALTVQFLDLAPLRAAIRQKWQSALAATVPAETPWRDLGRTQRHLVVVPPWQCSPEDTPGDYGIFGRLAVEQHMTINSFYGARYSEDQKKFFCNEQIAQIRRDGLREDTAYVFGRSKVGQLVGLQYWDNYCRYEDQYILCSRVPGRSGLDPAVLEDVEILHSGDVVSFEGADKKADHLVGLGWSGPVSGGRLMLGYSASLVFRLPSQPRGDPLIELSVIAPIPPGHPRQHLEILANGRLVMRQTFEQGTGSDIHLVIPSGAISADGLVRLDLNSADPELATTYENGLLSLPVRSIGVRQLHIVHAGD
jgi:hypothetical protein